MSEQHPYRATIPAVPDATTRPLWSVMIPTYNCAKYLRETLIGVLAQDPGAEVMQIEVIDDHSTKDDPAAIVEELGRGRVAFYRQPQNVGLTKNFQTCLERSRGKLIHLLHGDDCVRDGFYRKIQRPFEENPEIGAAFCRYIYTDEQGHWQRISPLEQPESGVLNNWLERIVLENRIQTPSIVVRRDVYEKLGNFDIRLSSCEDWEMWVRIAAKYPFWYETEPLALYRVHSNSNTERHMRIGKEIQNKSKAVDIVKNYLPHECADKISKAALEGFTLYTLRNNASIFASNGDVTSTINLIMAALNCSHSLSIFRSALKLIIKVVYLKAMDKIRKNQYFMN
jgi:glycosyltransferase involved in cell wall biosynthesis